MYVTKQKRWGAERNEAATQLFRGLKFWLFDFSCSSKVFIDLLYHPFYGTASLIKSRRIRTVLIFPPALPMDGRRSRKAGSPITLMTPIMEILITTITSVTAGTGPRTPELDLPQSTAFSPGLPSAPWQR